MALKRRTIIIVSVGAILLIAAIVLVLLFATRSTESIKREGLFGFIDSVNPFNAGSGILPGDNTGDDEFPAGDEVPVATSTLPRLRKIAIGPVAGYVATTTKNGVSFRYIERKTGHVYDAGLTEEKTTRVTNSTIPRIQQAALVQNGIDVLFAYLGSGFSSTNTLTGTVSDTDAYLGFNQISDEMSEFVASPTKNSFAAFSYDETGGRVSVVTKQEKVVFRSTIKKWRGSWMSANSLVVYPVATALAPNAIYSLSEAGSFQRIVGNKYGLEAVGWGDWFLLSFSTEAIPQTYLYNRKNEAWSPLSITTLADKCVFSTNTKTPAAYCGVPGSFVQGAYPDVWHEGRVAFTDSIWMIDIAASDVAILTNIPEAVDAVNLQLTPDGKYLGFLNKRDGSLWALRLSED